MCHHPSQPRRRSPQAFTLIELLVVIVIIAVLAAIILMATSRMRVSSAKAATMSEMRSIHAGVAAWAADHNGGEPFYAANGTGTYSHERYAGTDQKIAPANPAVALYNKESPVDGYVTDYKVFFNRLADYEIPERKNYHPEKADTTHLWGTYAWFYPSVPKEQFTTRQQESVNSGDWAMRQYNRPALGQLLMAPDYMNCNPTFGKIYIALMKDGSIIDVGTGKEAWERWLYP